MFFINFKTYFSLKTICKQKYPRIHISFMWFPYDFLYCLGFFLLDISGRKGHQFGNCLYHIDLCTSFWRNRGQVLLGCISKNPRQASNSILPWSVCQFLTSQFLSWVSGLATHSDLWPKIPKSNESFPSQPDFLLLSLSQ